MARPTDQILIFDSPFLDVRGSLPFEDPINNGYLFPDQILLPPFCFFLPEIKLNWQLELVCTGSDRAKARNYRVGNPTEYDFGSYSVTSDGYVVTRGKINSEFQAIRGKEVTIQNALAHPNVHQLYASLVKPYLITRNISDHFLCDIDSGVPGASSNPYNLLKENGIITEVSDGYLELGVPSDSLLPDNEIIYYPQLGCNGVQEIKLSIREQVLCSARLRVTLLAVSGQPNYPNRYTPSTSNLPIPPPNTCTPGPVFPQD